jgi:hypothetical protein
VLPTTHDEHSNGDGTAVVDTNSAFSTRDPRCCLLDLRAELAEQRKVFR